MEKQSKSCHVSITYQWQFQILSPLNSLHYLHYCVQIWIFFTTVALWLDNIDGSDKNIDMKVLTPNRLQQNYFK